MALTDIHLKSIGYILWIFGFTGAHRFYYGKPVTGTIWFFNRRATQPGRMNRKLVSRSSGFPVQPPMVF